MKNFLIKFAKEFILPIVAMMLFVYIYVLLNRAQAYNHVEDAFKTTSQLRAGWSVEGYSRIGTVDNVTVNMYGARLKYKTYQKREVFSHTCQIDATKPTRIAVSINGTTTTFTFSTLPNTTNKIYVSGPPTKFYNAFSNEPLMVSSGFNPSPKTVAGLLGKSDGLIRIEQTLKNGKVNKMFVGAVTDTGNGALCVK